MDNDNSQHRAFNGYDGEVNLVDLWEVLTRRKTVAISALGLVLLCAVAFVVFSKPVYESKSVIQVGQVGLVGPLEETAILVQRLQAKHPFIGKIEEGQGKTSSIITISVQAPSQAEASQRLRKITDELFDEHKVKFDTVIASHQEKYASVRQHIDTIKGLISELSLLIIEMTKKKELAQATILVLEKSNLAKSLSALEESAITLNRNMNHPLSMRTSFIAEPTSPATPIKPRPRIIITLSIILGLILGILSAFLVESIGKVRQQMANRRSKSIKGS